MDRNKQYEQKLETLELFWTDNKENQHIATSKSHNEASFNKPKKEENWYRYYRLVEQ